MPNDKTASPTKNAVQYDARRSVAHRHNGQRHDSQRHDSQQLDPRVAGATFLGDARSSFAPSLDAASQQPLIPTWDYDRRELRYGGQLIKHFKWKAINQERVLMAFEEEGWPDCIDDPLPPSANVNPNDGSTTQSNVLTETRLSA